MNRQRMAILGAVCAMLLALFGAAAQAEDAFVLGSDEVGYVISSEFWIDAAEIGIGAEREEEEGLSFKQYIHPTKSGLMMTMCCQGSDLFGEISNEERMDTLLTSSAYALRATQQNAYVVLLMTTTTLDSGALMATLGCMDEQDMENLSKLVMLFVLVDDAGCGYAVTVRGLSNELDAAQEQMDMILSMMHTFSTTKPELN